MGRSVLGAWEVSGPPQQAAWQDKQVWWVAWKTKREGLPQHTSAHIRKSQPSAAKEQAWDDPFAVSPQEMSPLTWLYARWFCRASHDAQAQEQDKEGTELPAQPSLPRSVFHRRAGTHLPCHSGEPRTQSNFK